MRRLNERDDWVRDISHRFLGFLEDRFAPLTLMVLVVVITLAILFWDSWRGEESGSTAIRNLVLVIATIAALPLAIWRSKVAERQAATAQRQSETAQRGLLNERYQKGAEMLGSSVLAVRLGGIYALARLAREHLGDYHTQIMSLLCAFVRHPAGEPVEVAEPISGRSLTPTAEFNRGWHRAGNDLPLRVREDIQAIMTAVRERSEAQIEIEKEGEYRLNLSGANLNDAYLFDANLYGANLKEAKLNRANLVGAKLEGAYLMDAELASAKLCEVKLNRANLDRVDLTGADLLDAKLKRVNLVEANLDGANLDGANLTGAFDMRGCKGLIQEQIDQAVALPDNPPNLEGVVDANTGNPLVWRGASPSE